MTLDEFIVPYVGVSTLLEILDGRTPLHYARTKQIAVSTLLEILADEPHPQHHHHKPADYVSTLLEILVAIFTHSGQTAYEGSFNPS